MSELIKITRESGIPLIGCIAFGVIDRGTNLIQVRPISSCNLKCVYCSTSSNSELHPYEYVVEPTYLIEWVKYVVRLKEDKIIVFIDSVGETLLYSEIVQLVSELKKINGIERIIMVTNGTLLNKEKIHALKEAGLDQINLSINALDKELARELSGCSGYDIEKIVEIVHYVKEENIDLVLTPVWVPGLNDSEIKKVIQFAKDNNLWIGLQKYEAHKYGRRPRGVKEQTYWKFYNALSEFEKEFDIKLRLGPSDFGIKRSKKLPLEFKKGEVVNVVIKAPGWYKDQMIGVAKNKGITIVDCNKGINSRMNVKIIENSNNLYIAKKA